MSSNDVPSGPGVATRPRKNTLETFNDELSVLDRPLEGEVEYYDDQPTPSRWRRLIPIAAVAVLLGGGAAMLLTRDQSGTLALAERQPDKATAAPTPTPHRSALAPATVEPPPAIASAPEARGALAEADDGDVSLPQPTRVAWSKIRPAGGHLKHASARHHARHR
jgi:hypothetical protein